MRCLWGTSWFRNNVGKRLSKILQVDLPDRHDERIRELHEIACALPYHQRYIGGEFRQVWTDLHELGPEIR